VQNLQLHINSGLIKLSTATKKRKKVNSLPSVDVTALSLSLAPLTSRSLTTSPLSISSLHSLSSDQTPPDLSASPLSSFLLNNSFQIMGPKKRKKTKQNGGKHPLVTSAQPVQNLTRKQPSNSNYSSQPNHETLFKFIEAGGKKCYELFQYLSSSTHWSVSLTH
jgi:hypothetical protein